MTSLRPFQLARGTTGHVRRKVLGDRGCVGPGSMRDAATRSRRHHDDGFSLVELMIVVALIGVLSTIAIQGVRRYLAQAKHAEMSSTLGAIAKAGVVAYEMEKSPAVSVAETGASVATGAKVFCTNAVMVPSIDRVRGTKYQSQPSDWQTGSATSGWRCLRFSIDSPQYFAYGYVSTQVVGGGTFSANARGDLDGDGQYSEFQLNGAAADGVVRIAPAIREVYPGRE